MSYSAKMILPPVLLFKETEDGIWASGALLPSLLEQLIASGATQVTITDIWRYKDILPQLPDIYKHYIVISNEEARAREIALQIYRPIFEELDIETDSGVGFRQNNKSLDRGIFEDAICSFSDFISYITAIYCKSQLQFNVSKMIERLSRLFEHLRNPDSRSQVACLLPIFSTYKIIVVSGVEINQPNEDLLADRLHEILQSAEFRTLSESKFTLGMGRTLSVIATQLKRKTKNLLAIAPAKSILGYSASIVSAATSLPTPKSDLAESFLSENFLPPAIDLHRQISAAQTQFNKTVNSDLNFKYLGYNDEK